MVKQGLELQLCVLECLLLAGYDPQISRRHDSFAFESVEGEIRSRSVVSRRTRSCFIACCYLLLLLVLSPNFLIMVIFLITALQIMITTTSFTLRSATGSASWAACRGRRKQHHWLLGDAEICGQAQQVGDLLLMLLIEHLDLETLEAQGLITSRMDII